MWPKASKNNEKKNKLFLKLFMAIEFDLGEPSQS